MDDNPFAEIAARPALTKTYRRPAGGIARAQHAGTAMRMHSRPSQQQQHGGTRKGALRTDEQKMQSGDEQENGGPIKGESEKGQGGKINQKKPRFTGTHRTKTALSSKQNGSLLRSSDQQTKAGASSSTSNRATKSSKKSAQHNKVLTGMRLPSDPINVFRDDSSDDDASAVEGAEPADNGAADGDFPRNASPVPSDMSLASTPSPGPPQIFGRPSVTTLGPIHRPLGPAATARNRVADNARQDTGRSIVQQTPLMRSSSQQHIEHKDRGKATQKMTTPPTAAVGSPWAISSGAPRRKSQSFVFKNAAKHGDSGSTKTSREMGSVSNTIVAKRWQADVAEDTVQTRPRGILISSPALDSILNNMIKKPRSPKIRFSDDDVFGGSEKLDARGTVDVGGGDGLMERSNDMGSVPPPAIEQDMESDGSGNEEQQKPFTHGEIIYVSSHIRPSSLFYPLPFRQIKHLSSYQPPAHRPHPPAHTQQQPHQIHSSPTSPNSQTCPPAQVVASRGMRVLGLGWLSWVVRVRMNLWLSCGCDCVTC
ncbi:uncharacterized protein EV422DRAFT_511408 [Fimicolochytrium jonesii]|uniref:uncharacterized protein n=1 Tax=Fimicolochytrium jonesii TaxID=1396493 RepID=UPI0022FDE00D|nr:uncharacterized protein EV422DRAFT_511408 [Fimicolochytrium jonesii]KAI8826782.1 hypothetical protein EV422DRAFT_511408 [Fimicolochytrium jonesii]